MNSLSDKTAKVLGALIGVAGESSRGERPSVNVWTEELTELVGGPAHVPFRDEVALRECADWCSENGFPLLTMMLSADKDGMIVDQLACKLAFKHGVVPNRVEMKKAWLAEREEIAALTEEDIAGAEEALVETVDALNASKEPKGRRALANARNQDVEAKSLEEWLARYQADVLDVKAPGQPLIHNDFMESQESYKELFWNRWNKELGFGEWSEDKVGSGEFVDALKPTFEDNDANWITKRFGGFDLRAKLEEKRDGIRRFEKVAYGFYSGDMVAREFFEEAVSLLGRQYPVISHLMFLKDKGAYVPVKPDVFETGLRKLGVEFYLSGYCSWDNYTRFLGYLERIRQMLLGVDPETTLLDAHSVLWIIGSGYWFDGEGAKEIEKEKAANVR